ncbi:14305_t:CDS:2, partial [Ambispora leptoticha]
MEGDLFSIISRGAKFDKHRFGKDIALFKPQSSSTQNEVGQQEKNDNDDVKTWGKRKKITRDGIDIDSSIRLLQEIDFFQNSRQALESVLVGLCDDNNKVHKKDVNKE